MKLRTSEAERADRMRRAFFSHYSDPDAGVRAADAERRNHEVLELEGKLYEPDDDTVAAGWATFGWDEPEGE